MTESFKTPGEAIAKYGKPTIKVRGDDNRVVVLTLQQMPDGTWRYL